MGFLAMGLACRHINLGVPDGADAEKVRITHTIESFLIINWVVTLVFSIMTALGTPHWDSESEEKDKLGRKHALAVAQFLTSLILIGLFSGHYQKLTSGQYTEAQLGLNGVTGEFMDMFGVLFAVLQMMTAITLYQQCAKENLSQSEETLSAVLRIALAFGLLAFGFACRHIYLGMDTAAGVHAAATIVAIESWIIINFFVTLFIHLDVRHHDWSVPERAKSEGSTALGLVCGAIQASLAIILIGLLAAELQVYTGSSDPDAGHIGLNDAGLYMIGFGLIFAVFEAAAGFTMLERKISAFSGTTANAVFVTNKVALAIGWLAMGFACRHINLTLRDATPSGADSSSVALVHAIESFLIINFFVTWGIQFRSDKIDW